MISFSALLISALGLSQLVAALPKPQSVSGSGASCNEQCTQVLRAAQTCSQEPAAQQGACLCDTPGFVTSGNACIACGGGDIFTTSTALSVVQVALDGCDGSSSVTSSSASSSATGGGGSINPTVASDIIPVTESAGQPISIAAWAPSGFSPVGTFNIAATGGANTTIAQIRTTTVTTESTTITATATAAFVLGPSDIVLVEGNDGFDDLIYCKLLNETTGDCVELEYAGTSLTASTEFTLVGATSTWVVYPVSGTRGASGVVGSGSAIATSPTAAATSGTGLVGSVAGLPTQPIATSASST